MAEAARDLLDIAERLEAAIRVYDSMVKPLEAAAGDDDEAWDALIAVTDDPRSALQQIGAMVEEYLDGEGFRPLTPDEFASLKARLS